jgi:hypothetical protein
MEGGLKKLKKMRLEIESGKLPVAPLRVPLIHDSIDSVASVG